MNQRETFLRKQLEVVEREKYAARIVINELAATWWGRLALRVVLRRIEKWSAT